MLMMPHTFFFILVYLMFIFFMFCVDSFFIFWSLMEMSTLVFMGISYSFFKNNFSSLMVFFIIQAVSAFSLLIFYCISSKFMFSLSLFLKLSMFPFFFWFMNVAFSFPTFILFFTSTIFKIPALIMVNSFYYLINYDLVFFSIISTIFVGALIMIFSNDLRMLLISSSVVNNSWFFMSQYVSMFFFMLYFVVYAFFLGCLLANSSFLFSLSNLSYNLDHNFLLIFSLLTLAGLPPFPLFYAKLLIVFLIMNHFSSFLYLLFVMLFTVFSMLGYLKHVFTIIMVSFSNSLYILMN